MRDPVRVILVVEDILSEVLLRRMKRHYPGTFQLAAALGKEGFGFIKKNMAAFNKVAATTAFIVMTDLDDQLCPQFLLRSWLREPLHPNLMFRVAIREAEAWLLADREALARYLKIRIQDIPLDSETVADPKKLVIDLARESRSDEIRDALVPGPGRRRKVGPDYNGCLLRFVFRDWDPEEARKRSRSLHRALLAFERFEFDPGEKDSAPGFNHRGLPEEANFSVKN